MTTYRKCKLCRKRVKKEDVSIFHLKSFCSFEHLKEYMRTEQGQTHIRRQIAVSERREKEKLKTKKDYIKEAQAAVNKYVRMRDIYKGYGCISCKKDYDGNKYNWDAGHLISRKNPKTRFNLWNINLQCVKCNRYGYGELLEYRSNLIARIGKDKVEWIQDHFRDEQRFDIEYLVRMKKIFNKKARKLEQKIQHLNVLERTK